MLEKEFNHYLSHQKELVKKYKGKFIIIKGEEILGAYETEKEAYETIVKDHTVGSFLIQHCLPGKEGITQSFHSRVVFS
ncbi:hypothetical protein KJ596_01715 [Patescibacteria group bacterium]|nr:hypothetical protein [Patescibacteria group bacterium]MBU1868381.1 hypothetical protein [Patescibacteria group bacterium]